MRLNPLIVELHKAGGGYWYMATPYSNCPLGTLAAFQEAARVGAWFVRHGIGVFSPITHTHPIAVFGGLDVADHDIWIPADKPMMDAAYGLAFVKMPGWECSTGMALEVDEFVAAGKPVVNIPWPLPK